MVKIIKYSPAHKAALISLIEELQDYLVDLDPLKRLRRLPEYGEIYVNNLLKNIKKNHGIILVAEIENTAVGLIAGIFDHWDTDKELGNIPSKPARILELIVSEKFRGQNLGSQLMDKIEEHFKSQGSDIMWVEVFEPNEKTHGFYKKLGYHDRGIDMAKKLS